MFHCFGCHKGGDVYTFLMEYEHMEFLEALRFLAKRAGIALVETPQQGYSSSKKERFFEINTYALDFYSYLLVSHGVGKKALSYLEERKINAGIVKKFRLGFAPKSGHALIDYLTKKKKVSIDEVIEVGLALRVSGRPLDFFRDRLIFPLIDHRDNTLGFAGRILADVPNAPKYINTRDTLIYHKGENFFGFNLAKEEMRKEDSALLVEGEFDVLSCVQEGIANTIALKGTALTERQVSLLSRYVTRLILALDDDKAGQDALVRSIPLLEKSSLHVSVLVLPEGKDPADSLSQNPGTFKKALKNAVPVYDFLIEKALRENDLNLAEGKRNITDFLLPLLAGISNEVVKEHYLRRLSTQLGTTYESLSKEVEKRQTRKKDDEPIVRTKDKRPRNEVLEEYLLALILQAQEQQGMVELASDILLKEMKDESANQKILTLFLKFFSTVENPQVSRFEADLPEEFIHTYNKASLTPLTVLDEKQYRSEVKKTATDLLRIYLRQNLLETAGKIKEEDDAEELVKLQEKYAAIRTRLSEIKN